MTLRLLVSCDSNPAPYAGGQDWPCRAWLTVNATSPHAANLAAVREGWTVALTVTAAPEALTWTHTCPACVRALAVLTGSTHP